MHLDQPVEGRTAGGSEALASRYRRALVVACAWLLIACSSAGAGSSASVAVTGRQTDSPPSVSPGTPAPTPFEMHGPIGAFCGLVDPAAVETVLGAPAIELRAERSTSGGAWCSYSRADIDEGEGVPLFVGFDRTPNLQRWRPTRLFDAQAAYAQRRSELSAGDPGQDISGMGLAAWQGTVGSALALFPPDVLVDLSYDPRASSAGAGLDLLRGIEAALATGVPADPGPVDACTLLTYQAVQGDLGQFVEEVTSYAPFLFLASGTELPTGGATGCAYMSRDPVDPLGFLTVAEVVRYRTDAVRDWLTSDASIGIASDEERALASDMDAAGWAVRFFAGEPVEIAGTCQASWAEPSLFLMLDPDDVVVLGLPPGASQGAAHRLAGRIVAAAESERGAPAACRPLG